MSTPELLKAERWLTLWNVLVISGAVLTAISTFFVIRYGDKVSFLKDEELSRFQTEAQRDIAEANEKAQDAIRGQKQLEADAEEAKLKQREAERRTEEVRLQVEQEKAARTKIEAQLAPRRISGEQEDTIRKHLLGMRSPNVTLFIVAGNPEVSDFAGDIERAFRAAGLTVDINRGFSFGGLERGIQMTYGTNRRSDAEIVAGALRAAKVVQDRVPATPAEKPDVLVITIFPK